MQIILVDRQLKSAQTLHLGKRHVVLVGALLAVSVLVVSAVFAWAATRFGGPSMRKALALSSPVEQAHQDAFVRENLAEMAKRVGEMQAQMMRLDALGERLGGMAGIKPQEFTFQTAPGRGGAVPSAQRALSMEELSRELSALQQSAEQRTDYLNVLEANLINAQVKQKFVPTQQPVSGYNGSGYGWRIDPFTGGQAFHEGIDFHAPSGTSIHAAAGGVVTFAGYHAGYGNLVTIDHGNDLVTRYAHASRVLVRVGELVKLNHKVAEVGSTGRSTGPHLHFEVLVKGVQVDPNKFLLATKRSPAVAAR